MCQAREYLYGSACICRPAGRADEEPCAEKILSNLGHHAYRRPVTANDVNGLLEFYKAGRDEGGSFDQGIESALQRILADVEFIYRGEREPAPEHRKPGFRRHFAQ